MTNAIRQLAAIMFTDMVGYTSLMQQNEVLAVEKKDKFRKCFEESISRHEGRILQYNGDGVNVASRMESLAVPGSIFISERLFDEIKNQLPVTCKP